MSKLKKIVQKKVQELLMNNDCAQYYDECTVDDLIVRFVKRLKDPISIALSIYDEILMTSLPLNSEDYE